MIEIICQGKSPSEAKAKCEISEILLTEKLLTEKYQIPIDTVINILNAIGGISIVDVGSPSESEE